jgi:AcrR family transcriptional regulator
MDQSPISETEAASTAERLLLAAEQLVVGEGVHALSVRRIAGLAGVNSALIRYHFGGSDGLLRELALRNAARIAQSREALLGQGAGFAQTIEALIQPLWATAAMGEDYRAIIVLDEIFSRATAQLRQEIWALFADGVAQVAARLGEALPEVAPDVLQWRIRFVTAAALDVPPRGVRVGDDSRLEQFRQFAIHALRP